MGRIAGILTPDLLVVGAGPAGVSAALWARSRGLSVRVIERAARPGGQLHAVHFHPRELPGIESADGAALAAAYGRQLAAEAIDVRYACAAAAVVTPDDPASPAAVVAESGERFEARAVLVATGLRRRRLEVPGERELEGRGVSYSATRDRATFVGKAVAVVGGGDAAYVNALLLAEADCDVTLLVRDHPIARAEFRERVAANARMHVIEGVYVAAFVGVAALEAVRIKGREGGRDLAVAGAVIKVGALPNTEWCGNVLARDPDGYLHADAEGRTSHAAVWAAGDVTRPGLPAIVVAEGGAALAVASVERALRAGSGVL